MTIRNLITPIVLVLSATSAFAQDRTVVPPHHWPMAGWPWWIIPLCMVTMIVFFMVLGTVMCRIMRHHRGAPLCGQSPSATDPKQILRERLARGEITEEEFDAIATKIDSR